MNHADPKIAARSEAQLKSLKQQQTTHRNSKSSNPLMIIFHMLASLRLTVTVLILSVFVIWVATLQQAELDIWDVKRLHFPWLIVNVPLYTFCPPAWLPQWRTQLAETLLFGRPVSLPIPSGFAVISAMIINLTAAHSLRFRLQASGTRLNLGLVLCAIGIAACAAVVVMGQSRGLQAQPPVAYSTMWNLVLLAMLGCGAGMGFVALKFDRHRSAEKILAGSFAALLLGIPVLLWQTGGFIGDSGMRILWQIAQCGVASLVLLGGLQMVFKRKGGIVLLHAGMLLLLGNEIWVTLTHVEQRMTAKEGQTISYAYDIRDTELAIVDRSGETDKIISIPSSQLRTKKWIDIPGTDMKVMGVDFFQNSDLGMATSTNPATAGLGSTIQAVDAQVVNGLNTDGVNMASAYIMFQTKAGKYLGTYLVSQGQQMMMGPIFKSPNTLAVDDKSYSLTLWFQRFYKPYNITINDVQAENYPGTEIPRWYASEFKIDDLETNFDSEQKVWMNNPLRYRNETFYQSGYFKNPDTGEETTTFQIVLNRGWMIPYLCCAMVAVGILAQFIPTMLTYLDKAQRQPSSPTPASTYLSTPTLDDPKRKSGWLVPTIAALILGLIFIGWGMPKKILVDKLNLNGLAQLPVSYKGRIQPFDSLARTMLRMSIGLEQARSPEETMFGTKRFPATRWLADSLFDESPEINFRVFRVDNRQILDALKLPHRSGFRYSIMELEPHIDQLADMDSKARAKKKELRDNTDKSVLDLTSNLAFVRAVQRSLKVNTQSLPNWNAKVFDAAATITTTNLPGVIPGPEAGAPWLALNTARMRQDLAGLAQSSESQKSDDIAVGIINYAIAESLVRDPLVSNEMPAELEGKTEQEKVSFFAKRIASLPIEQIRALITNGLGMDAQKYIPAVFSASKQVSGGDQYLPLNPTQLSALSAWQEIATAYQKRDQAALDQAITDYKAVLNADATTEVPWGTISAEFQLNGWSPFYLCSVMYLIAAIFAAVSIVGWTQSINRFTFIFIVTAFAIHTIGMILRIYISGRAPVTSIYSSALAIAWGSVLCFILIEFATKKGLGNFLAGLSGFGILLVAYGLSLTDDTFAVLRAVLDTQFWLWTHVTCVALGYVLTLVAGFWAIGMLGSAIWPSTQREDIKRSAEITYGLLCAATFLSFVGTVLGGLWADDSWGRFWGWDPKENGAAMIVLWNAAVIHARWAGLIRYRGLAAMAIFGNIVTAWSWFAVNELGIGLHAYGFTEGVIVYLTAFWISQFVAMAMVLLPFKVLNAKAA